MRGNTISQLRVHDFKVVHDQQKKFETNFIIEVPRIKKPGIMDIRQLNKVLGQLVSETKLDYDNDMVTYPFTQPVSFNNSLDKLSHYFFFYFITLVLCDRIPYILFPFLSSFFDHCECKYGLNEREVDYIWYKYRKIITDKMRNNG